DESETKSPQIVPSFVQSAEQVKSLRHSVQHSETFIPAATPKPASPRPSSNGTRRNRKACFVHITHSSSPKTSNSPLRVTAVKASVVNVAQGMQGKWEWRTKCPILDHVSRNTSASMTVKRFDYNDAIGRSKKLLIVDAQGTWQGTCPIYLILKSSMVDMLPLEAGTKSAQVPKHAMTARAANHDRRDGISMGISTAHPLATAPIRTGPCPEPISGPAYAIPHLTETHRRPPFTFLSTISSTL
nr:hypothetical protein [Tanacetum cinerariifolium]